MSWWQPNTLTGQPDKMFIDLRNSKWSRELSAYLMETRSVVRIIMFRILCFHAVCRTVWPRYKIQQCHCFIAPPANTPVGLSYHFLMQPSRSQHLHKYCTLPPLALKHYLKTNTALFHAQWPFKLVHAASLSSRRRTTAFWGNLSPLQ